MKVKTSITLSKDLLKAIDLRARKQKTSRSDFIEISMERLLRQLARDESDARDVEIINRNAEALNREVMDVLEYQIPL